MRFTYPWLIYATPILTGLLWLVLWLGERRRARLRTVFTGAGNRPWADPGYVPRRKLWERLLTLAAFALLLITLSGPRRYRPAEKSEMQGLPYIIALDASRSMEVTDVRPTRWAAMTNSIDTYLKGITGDRVGLISFAGRAYLNAPLTFDTLALRTTLKYLSPDAFMDEQGSDFADVVDRAGRYFESNNIPTRVVIMLTDGEQFEGELMPRIYHWAHKGLKVITVGVGTTTGGYIPEPAPTAARPKSEPILAVLDRASLGAIARAGGGAYFELDRDADRDIANRIIEETRGRASFRGAEESTEPLYWRCLFAAACLVCLGALFVHERAELWLQVAGAVGVLAVLARLVR